MSEIFASLPHQQAAKHGKTFSLYIHVPFCRSKCPYCAFYSFRPQAGQIERWLVCLLKELEKIRAIMPKGCALATIYFGGGTPSLLSLEIWRSLLAELALFPRCDDCEFTVEANPESIDAQKIALWRSGGVNRISIGVQSLDDLELKALARPHTADEALKKIELCQNGGFHISCDLMFGLPNQTLRSLHKSMARLVQTGIGHTSVYQLSIEEDSFWGKRPPQNLPDGYPMYRFVQYYLPNHSLKQYEISSFARPGQESLHNVAYWRRSNVYAAGPGAWGFLDGRRFSQRADLEKWAECVENNVSPIDFEESLAGAAEASEAAILALRTASSPPCFEGGINFADFSRRYGTGYLDKILARLREIPQEDLIWRENSVSLSQRGMRVGNAIWAELTDI